MDYCQCGSLSSYIYGGNGLKGNELTEAELREVASCLVLGLAYLHSKHVFHRVSNGEWNECIGYQTIELSDIQQWLDSTGWFWYIRTIEPFLVKKNGSKGNSLLQFTRDVWWEGCRAEEWHMGVGHYADWTGRTKESVRRLHITTRYHESHSKWRTAFTLFIEMVISVCWLHQQVFGEGWECSMECKRPDGRAFFIVE